MDVDDLLLDFRITSRCHQGCDLCFRNPDIGDKTFDEACAVIHKMFNMGFKKIGFTGGEPTERHDYLQMIKYAKELGFLTYLSTVGHKFLDHMPQLNPMLNWVGLPIDGVSPETNIFIRSNAMQNQHEVIKRIFDELSKTPTPIKIKLTTVVSEINLNQLDDIILFVKNLPYKFHTWRFYQFCPLGLGKNKREKLEIPTEQFIENMKLIKEKYHSLPISYATFKDRDQANILMEPNFDIIIPEGDSYIYLCNMQKDSEQKIMSILKSKQDALKKCAANRFWINQ